MRWAYKFRKELTTGQYWDLLARDFIKPHDQEPEIAGLMFYIDAFRELGTSRPVGLGLSPIPFTAIAEYSRIYELDDPHEFAEIIRHLDDVFLELNEETQKREGNKNASGNSNKNNNDKGRLPG